MIFTENSQELFQLMKLIDSNHFPKGKLVGIVSNAGGPGIIAVDRIEAEGLELAEINEKTRQKFLKYLPEETNLTNPVDILGDATVSYTHLDVYKRQHIPLENKTSRRDD